MKNIIKSIIIIVSIGYLTSCDETGRFNNGMATIQDFSSNKYGYINENKDLVIEKKYDWAGTFYSDYAVVELNGKTGLINKNGEIVIPLIHDNVQHIYDVKDKSAKYTSNYGDYSSIYFEVTDNGKSGVFNFKNQEIIPNVAFGNIKIVGNKYFEVKLNEEENSVCLFSNKGKQITEAKFSSVSDIVNNYAILLKKEEHNYSTDFYYKIYDLENPNNKINKLQFYDKIKLLNSTNRNNELLFKISNETSYALLGDHAIYEDAVVDYLGNIVIPFGKYSRIRNYGDGLYSVSVKGMQSGYADKNGELVIKPIFNDAGKFKNGKAKVAFKEKTFHIDKNGNCVNNCPTKKWLDFHKIKDFSVDKSLYAYLIRKGLRESEQEKYSSSIETFSRAIKENPLDYEAYHNRGLSYLMLNELNQAEEDLDKSIQYNPSYSDSYYLRGNVHKRKGSSYSAISDYEKAIELNPYNTDSYLKCAIVYGKQGNRQKSCEYMRKACELGNYDGCSGFSRFCE